MSSASVIPIDARAKAQRRREDLFFADLPLAICDAIPSGLRALDVLVFIARAGKAWRSPRGAYGAHFYARDWIASATTQARIAEDLRLSRKVVREADRRLCEVGWLVRAEPLTPGGHPVFVVGRLVDGRSELFCRLPVADGDRLAIAALNEPNRPVEKPSTTPRPRKKTKPVAPAVDPAAVERVTGVVRELSADRRMPMPTADDLARLPHVLQMRGETDLTDVLGLIFDRDRWAELESRYPRIAGAPSITLCESRWWSTLLREVRQPPRRAGRFRGEYDAASAASSPISGWAAR